MEEVRKEFELEAAQPPAFGLQLLPKTLNL